MKDSTLTPVFPFNTNTPKGHQTVSAKLKNAQVKKRRWYQQPELYVPWATLVAVVVGGVLRYWLIDRPAIEAQEESGRLTKELVAESKLNQSLIDKRLGEADANTASLRANLDQIRAQVRLSDATVDQIKDPTRKAADQLELERARLDRMKAIDELVDSLVPNLQIKQDVGGWRQHSMTIEFRITNAGTRALRVLPPDINIKTYAAPGNETNAKLPTSAQLSASICTPGFISPGESIRCNATLRSEIDLVDVGYIDYHATFEGITDLPAASETAKRMYVAYKPTYIQNRMKKSITFNGQWWR